MWLALAVLAGLLNVADAALTARAIDLGLATESNPWMAYLLGMSVPVFMLVKLGVAGLLVWLGCRNSPLARAGVVVGLLSYAGIVTYHVVALLAG